MEFRYSWPVLEVMDRVAKLHMNRHNSTEFAIFDSLMCSLIPGNFSEGFLLILCFVKELPVGKYSFAEATPISFLVLEHGYL